MGAILIWSLNYLVALIYLEMPLRTPLTQHGGWLFPARARFLVDHTLSKELLGHFAMGTSVASLFNAQLSHIG